MLPADVVFDPLQENQAFVALAANSPDPFVVSNYSVDCETRREVSVEFAEFYLVKRACARTDLKPRTHE